jgi:hypothetical protein
MSMRLLATIGLCVALATSALAPAALAAGDDGFGAFWQGFSAAAAHDDVASLQTLVAVGSIEDSDGKPMTFAQIQALYLKAAARRCLAKAHPVSGVDGTGAINYSAFCGQLVYVFTKTNGGWKLTDFSPDD